MAMVLSIFSVIFVFGPFANALADRIAREGAAVNPADPGEVGRLREEVERLSTEVARLHDEQSFMLRLLGEGERGKLIDRERSDG
jgi:hypothetical protein